MSWGKLPFYWLIIFVFSSQIGIAQVKLFTNDELPTDHVYRITQDKEGYIWILTEEGIVKYDGTNVKTFTVKDGLPTNDVFNFHITENNQLWFMCMGRELGYIENDSVYSYKLPELNTVYFNVINYGKEHITFNHSNKSRSYQLINKKWIVNQYEKAIDIDSYTRIDFENIEYSTITNPTTFSFYSKKNKKLFSFIDSEKNLKKAILFSIYPNYLAITVASKVYFKQKNNTEIITLNFEKYNSREILINYVNNEFQITGDNFVVKLNDQLEIIEEYIFDSKYNAHANFIDREGNIWLGSFTTGVHFISKNEYSAILKDKEKDIRQSLIFNDKLYYTNYNGINEFNSNERYFSENDHFTTLAKSGKQLFIGKTLDLSNNYAVSEEKINSESVKTFGFRLDEIIKHKNTTYITAFLASYLYDSNFVFQSYKEGNFNSLINYKNSLIYGNNNGLYYFNTDKSYYNFTKPVLKLKVQNEKLYIGTDGFGLSILENERIKNYALKNTIINDILLYKDNLLFCSTNKGVICIMEKDDSLIPYYVYNKKDGLISNHINAVHIDATENIYIATKKGILRTKLKKPKDVLSLTYPIVINDIKWNEKCIKDSTYNFVNENVINSLNIKFSSVKFSESEFYYKLNDNDYTLINTGEIALDNLLAGDYRLTLKIKSPFSQENTKTIEFIIRDKWYNTNWFWMVFVCIILTGLFFLIRRNQIKKNDRAIFKLKKQAELSDYKLHALRSQMNPHFIFNSLNSIQYYISENKKYLSEKYLVKFANLIRKFFEIANEKEISIKRETQLLDNYLEIEKMRFEEKLNYTITIDEELDQSISIPTMILQPIVENAVNHGVFHKESDGTINIFFSKKKGNQIQVIITDDGVGVENSKSLKSASMNKHLSKSTLIFKERVDLLNNSEEWEITYSIDQLRNHSTYPGTKTRIIFKKK